MKTKGFIEFEGETLDDCEQAIVEALNRIMDDYTTGKGVNERATFRFEVDTIDE